MDIIQRTGEVPRKTLTDLCSQVTKVMPIGSRTIKEIEPTFKYFSTIEESY